MCVKVIFLCNVKGLLVPVHPVPDLVDPGIPVRSIRILDLQCMVILATHTEGHRVWRCYREYRLIMCENSGVTENTD